MNYEIRNKNSYKIDIIIPVYKNERLTKACIDSIFTHISEISEYAPRVILVNDSPDYAPINQLLENFQGKFNNVIIIKNENNIGFVKSVNKAFSISRDSDRAVVLVNSDTLTFENTLEKLVSAAEIDPQIGFACPRSNNAALSTMPRLPHSMGGLSLTPKQMLNNWKIISKNMPEITFSPTAVGFYLFIKREVIKNFGVLNEVFGLGYEEENDLIMRANKVGFRAVLANHSFAYHAGSASFLLKEIDVDDHKKINLEKLNSLHPEFLPLVKRFETSPEFLTEDLLKGLIPSSDGRLRIIFDLSRLGPNTNGTSEMAIAIISNISIRHCKKFNIAILCSAESYKFHNFEKMASVQRVDNINDGYAIAINLGQPFDLHQINVMEKLAPINIYGMLDVIAYDCGYLAAQYDTETLWDYVARTASGVFCISKFSELTLKNRFSNLKNDRIFTRLLPTKKSDYLSRYKNIDLRSNHILVLGNHFSHKNSDHTGKFIATKFPNCNVVVLGSSDFESGNLRGYKSGSVDDDVMQKIFMHASIVVLPSFYEGFGFGLMHAIALNKPVVARDIPATREILESYDYFDGIYLYENNDDISKNLELAGNISASGVSDGSSAGWSDWVDGFVGFADDLIKSTSLYQDCIDRIKLGNLVRARARMLTLESSISVNAGATNFNDGKASQNNINFEDRGPLDINQLLDLSGEDFIQKSYLSLLNRGCDADGFIHYMDRLQKGMPKIDIIRDIRNSREGRLLNSGIVISQPFWNIPKKFIIDIFNHKHKSERI